MVGAHRRIVVSLPASLLREMERLAGPERGARDRMIREAMKYYVATRKHSLRDLAAGYREMGSINLALAEEGLPADNEAQALHVRRPGAD